MDCTHLTKKHKKGHNDPDMVPLDKHIEIKRANLVSEREEAPKLREKADKIRQEYEHVTQRWLARKKKDMLLEALNLEEEANIRESMVREHEYECFWQSAAAEYPTSTAAAAASSMNNKQGY